LELRDSRDEEEGGMREWCHKVRLSSVSLAPELNAFAEQGWEIYKIWKIGYEDYEIAAYKDDNASKQVISPEVLETEIERLIYNYSASRIQTQTERKLLACVIVEYLKKIFNNFIPAKEN
jgi:hypothetical protein